MTEDHSTPSQGEQRREGGSQAQYADGWRPIETAPKDGAEVWAGTRGVGCVVWYPMRAVFDDGKWKADFGRNDWQSYDPQPTVWMPLQPSTVQG